MRRKGQMGTPRPASQRISGQVTRGAKARSSSAATSYPAPPGRLQRHWARPVPRPSPRAGSAASAPGWPALPLHRRPLRPLRCRRSPRSPPDPPRGPRRPAGPATGPVCAAAAVVGAVRAYRPAAERPQQLVNALIHRFGLAGGNDPAADPRLIGDHSQRHSRLAQPGGGRRRPAWAPLVPAGRCRGCRGPGSRPGRTAPPRAAAATGPRPGAAPSVGPVADGERRDQGAGDNHLGDLGGGARPGADPGRGKLTRRRKPAQGRRDGGPAEPLAAGTRDVRPASRSARAGTEPRRRQPACWPPARCPRQPPAR